MIKNNIKFFLSNNDIFFHILEFLIDKDIKNLFRTSKEINERKYLLSEFFSLNFDNKYFLKEISKHLYPLKTIYFSNSISCENIDDWITIYPKTIHIDLNEYNPENIHLFFFPKKQIPSYVKIIVIGNQKYFDYDETKISKDQISFIHKRYRKPFFLLSKNEY